MPFLGVLSGSDDDYNDDDDWSNKTIMTSNRKSAVKLLDEGAWNAVDTNRTEYEMSAHFRLLNLKSLCQKLQMS